MGNLAPEGSVIKSTAIDPSLIDENDVYRHVGPARVFTTEAAAIQAIKSGEVAQGDVMVLICGGPAGAGMQEIYQITSALKQLPHCKHVAVLTDARFSGVSTGACIGHISPEALAGGPIGKVLEGDQIEIVIDRKHLTGSVHLVGDAHELFGARKARDVWSSGRPAPGSPSASLTSGRHPTMGCVGSGQRRRVGRLRLRQRHDHFATQETSVRSPVLAAARPLRTALSYRGFGILSRGRCRGPT